ncbi:hypothetical protein ABZP36_025725 [Zizania latifolia]
MDSIEEAAQRCRRQEEEETEEIVVEVPEMDGDLLVELLDASHAAVAAEEADDDGETATRRKQQQQLLQVGDGWDMQELNSIHPRQEDGCEDCGLDDILSDFDGCGFPPPPYVVDDPVEFWMEKMDLATAGSFAGEFAEEWYMDGMAMDMEWEDGRSYYSLHFPSYCSDAACTDQLYSSPLWE